jgi:hypothetical protein
MDNMKSRLSRCILCLTSTIGTVALGFASPVYAGCGPLGLFECPPGPYPEWAIRKNRPIVQRAVVDPVYYADQYADLRQAFNYNHFALKKHWIEHGTKECRRSSPVFDARYYLNSYPDLQRAFGRDNCTKAVVHWYENGITEGRQGHPDFSPKCYLDRYPDLQRAFGAQNYAAAIEHYFDNGRNENRNGQCG